MKAKITLLLLLISVSLSYSQKKWSLQECVNHALEHNISIKRTTLTNQLVNEDVNIAKTNWLPSVSGFASQNINFGSNINPITNSRINTRSLTNGFGVNASMSIFDGFRIKNGLLSAEKNREISELDLEKLKNDISLNIVNSYLNVLFQKESLKVAQANLEITEKSLKRTEELIDAGTQPRGNLLEIEATKVNDENTIVIAENNIDLALLDLSLILQIPNKGFDVNTIEIKLNIVSLKLNDTEDIYNVALTNQPNIKSSELSIESAAINIEIAKANFLPSVTLNAGLDTRYSHISGIDNFSNPSFVDQLDENLGQFIGLRVSIPIYNKGQTKINVNRARINQEIAKTNLEDQKRGLRENIERAYISAKATLKEHEAATKSLEAQELAFNFAQERYALGATNSFDFEQVKNRLVSAKSAVIRAKYNYVFRTKVLEFYYGIPIVIN